MSPRRPTPVRLTEGDLDATADALTDVLPVAVLDVPLAPPSIDDLLGPLGATRKERIRRGAIALSGESRGKAYLAARRRLERYTTKGRERRSARGGVLATMAAAIRRPHLPTDASLTVSMEADVIYAGQTKRMPVGLPQVLTARELSTVRRHLRAGDERAAARALLDAWVFAYGLHGTPDAEGVIGNITTLDIELGR